MLSVALEGKEEVAKGVKNLTTQFSSLAKKIGNTSGTLTKMPARLKSIEQRANAVAGSITRLSDSIVYSKKQLSASLRTNVQKQVEQLEKLGLALQKGTREWNQYGNDVAEVIQKSLFNVKLLITALNELENHPAHYLQFEPSYIKTPAPLKAPAQTTDTSQLDLLHQGTEKQFSATGVSADELTKKMQILMKAQQNKAAETAKNSKVHTGFKAELGEVSKEVKRLTSVLKKSLAVLQKTRDNTRKTRDEKRKYGKQVRGTTADIQRLNTTSKNYLLTSGHMRGATSGLRHNIGLLRNTLLLYSFALGGVVAALARTAENSEKLKATFRGLDTVARSTSQALLLTKTAAIELSKDALISTMEAGEALRNLLTAGFGLPEATKMLEAMKDTAALNRKGNIEMGVAVVNATQGIRMQRSQMMQSAGVTQSLSLMYQEYARSIGVGATALTEAQKRQAVFNGILRQGQMFMGDAAKVAEMYTGVIASFKNEMFEVSAYLGDAIQPLAIQFTKMLQNIVKGMRGWVDQNRAWLRTEMPAHIKSTMVVLETIVKLLGLLVLESGKLVINAHKFLLVYAGYKVIVGTLLRLSKVYTLVSEALIKKAANQAISIVLDKKQSKSNQVLALSWLTSASASKVATGEIVRSTIAQRAENKAKQEAILTTDILTKKTIASTLIRNKNTQAVVAATAAETKAALVSYNSFALLSGFLVKALLIPAAIALIVYGLYRWITAEERLRKAKLEAIRVDLDDIAVMRDKNQLMMEQTVEIEKLARSYQNFTKVSTALLGVTPGEARGRETPSLAAIPTKTTEILDSTRLQEINRIINDLVRRKPELSGFFDKVDTRNFHGRLTALKAASEDVTKTLIEQNKILRKTRLEQMDLMVQEAAMIFEQQTKMDLYVAKQKLELLRNQRSALLQQMGRSDIGSFIERAFRQLLPQGSSLFKDSADLTALMNKIKELEEALKQYGATTDPIFREMMDLSLIPEDNIERLRIGYEKLIEANKGAGNEFVKLAVNWRDATGEVLIASDEYLIKLKDVDKKLKEIESDPRIAEFKVDFTADFPDWDELMGDIHKSIEEARKKGGMASFSEMLFGVDTFEGIQSRLADIRRSDETIIRQVLDDRKDIIAAYAEKMGTTELEVIRHFERLGYELREKEQEDHYSRRAQRAVKSAVELQTRLNTIEREILLAGIQSNAQVRAMGEKEGAKALFAMRYHQAEFDAQARIELATSTEASITQAVGVEFSERLLANTRYTTDIMELANAYREAEIIGLEKATNRVSGMLSTKARAYVTYHNFIRTLQREQFIAEEQLLEARVAFYDQISNDISRIEKARARERYQLYSEELLRDVARRRSEREAKIEEYDLEWSMVKELEYNKEMLRLEMYNKQKARVEEEIQLMRMSTNMQQVILATAADAYMTNVSRQQTLFENLTKAAFEKRVTQEEKLTDRLAAISSDLSDYDAKLLEIRLKRESQYQQKRVDYASIAKKLMKAYLWGTLQDVAESIRQTYILRAGEAAVHAATALLGGNVLRAGQQAAIAAKYSAAAGAASGVAALLGQKASRMTEDAKISDAPSIGSTTAQQQRSSRRVGGTIEARQLDITIAPHISITGENLFLSDGSVTELESNLGRMAVNAIKDSITTNELNLGEAMKR